VKTEKKVAIESDSLLGADVDVEEIITSHVNLDSAQVKEHHQRMLNLKAFSGFKTIDKMTNEYK